jgi:peptide-methionine (R)-S-oxide reductase
MMNSRFPTLSFVFAVMVALAGAVVLLRPVAGSARSREVQSMSEPITVWSVEELKLVTTERVVKSDAEWRAQLTEEQYRITRGHGTERACSSPWHASKSPGTYRCVCCGNDLFTSDRKFDSGTGWPSFWQPVHEANIGTSLDTSLGMRRIEVHCSRCGAHLGHVFEDGPRPSGLRYCINAVALQFVPAP